MHRIIKDNRCSGRDSNSPFRNTTEQCYRLSHLVKSCEIIIESRNMTIPKEDTVVIPVLGRPYYMGNGNGIFQEKACHIRDMQHGHSIRG